MSRNRENCSSGAGRKEEENHCAEKRDVRKGEKKKRWAAGGVEPKSSCHLDDTLRTRLARFQVCLPDRFPGSNPRGAAPQPRLCEELRHPAAQAQPTGAGTGGQPADNVTGPAAPTQQMAPAPPSQWPVQLPSAAETPPCPRPKSPSISPPPPPHLCPSGRTSSTSSAYSSRRSRHPSGRNFFSTLSAGRLSAPGAGGSRPRKAFRSRSTWRSCTSRFSYLRYKRCAPSWYC